MRFADITTMGVGNAEADIVECDSPESIMLACKSQILAGNGFFVVSGGSNIVVADCGFAGKIIKINPQVPEYKKNIQIVKETDTDVVLRAYAGVVWNDFVNFCIDNNFAGVEALCGIPGLVGASCVQNIGAYGAQVCDTFVSCTVFDFVNLKNIVFDRVDLDFGYRTSALKTKKIDGCVLWVDFCLQKSTQSTIQNTQLASALGVDPGSVVLIQNQKDAILKIREQKGMLLTCFGKRVMSSGSFFLNPIISSDSASHLPKDAVVSQVEDRCKVSAAWLIEQSGIKKGFRLPDSAAAVSEFHSLCIVNTGGASAQDVVELARFIRYRVLSEFGVELVPEVNIVGCDTDCIF